MMPAWLHINNKGEQIKSEYDLKFNSIIARGWGPKKLEIKRFSAIKMQEFYPVEAR